MTQIAQLIHIKVDEYATPCRVTATKDTHYEKLVELMDKENIRHIPIVENGKPVGIISDRDLRILKNIEWANQIKASDIMTENPETVITGTCLDKVAFKMSQLKIGSTLVVNSHGEIKGIFTVTDALNALIEILRGDLPK